MAKIQPELLHEETSLSGKQLYHHSQGENPDGLNVGLPEDAYDVPLSYRLRLDAEAEGDWHGVLASTG